MHAPRRSAWPWLLLGTLAGCGDDPAPTESPPSKGPSTPSPAPTTTGPGTEVSLDVPSMDAGIASIQLRIQQKTTNGQIDKSKDDWRTKLPLRPVAAFDPARTYLWTLETDVGSMRIRLLPERAPVHVSNLVYLTLLGFYDGLPLYKVTPGRDLESGCPVGDGFGTPGYQFNPEITEGNHFDRPGLLGSTGVGGATEDSKFRITFAAYPELDSSSTLYGVVESGTDVLKKLEATGGPDGKVLQRTVIRRARIAIR